MRSEIDGNRENDGDIDADEGMLEILTAMSRIMELLIVPAMKRMIEILTMMRENPDDENQAREMPEPSTSPQRIFRLRVRLEKEIL